MQYLKAFCNLRCRLVILVKRIDARFSPSLFLHRLVCVDDFVLLQTDITIFYFILLLYFFFLQTTISSLVTIVSERRFLISFNWDQDNLFIKSKLNELKP